jgi:hypothetical protein
MRSVLSLAVLSAVLMGCPKPAPQPKLVGSIRIIATYPDPGGACETEVITDLDKKGIGSNFELMDTAVRRADTAVVDDDLLIQFDSSVPVTGFFSGASNPVIGETQDFSANLPDGADSSEVAVGWKMAVELDDRDQYELFLDFYTP